MVHILRRTITHPPTESSSMTVFCLSKVLAHVQSIVEVRGRPDRLKLTKFDNQYQIHKIKHQSVHPNLIYISATKCINPFK